MSDESKALLKLVNSSGFLFQLRVEDEVMNTSSSHQKTVLAREYRWVDPITGGEGFIDLILTTGTNGKMVIECKRVIDATWLFLVPDGASPVKKANVLWSKKVNDDRHIAAWDEFRLNPESLESSFCIVRGQGEKDQSMLERISSILLRSTECLAEEEFNYHRSEVSVGLRFYFPVIVTTANLKICRYDSSNIDLLSGQIANANFEDVPFLRFTKSMSTRLLSSRTPSELSDSARESQRTIFVMNAASLSISLLGNWGFDLPALGKKWPWDLPVWRDS